MRSGDALWYTLPQEAAPRSIFGLNELLAPDFETLTVIVGFREKDCEC